MKCIIKGDFLKARREELGLTIQEVADFVGADKSSVSRWESGATKNMRLDYADKLAVILRVDARELIEIEDDKSPGLAGLSKKKRDFIASVYDMTDDQVELIQRLVDQIKGRN